MAIELIRTMTFCAAHRVPDWPKEHGQRIHGHTYAVDLVLEGEIEPATGWLIDFGDIKRAFVPIIDRLDHSCLNEIEGIESGALDSISQWIFDRLKPSLSQLKHVNVRVLGEQDFALERLPADPGLDLPERVAFSIEAAHRLPSCGDGHRCRDLHGHSYRIEVAAGDLAALEGPLRRIHDRLDHRYLNEIEGLENPTSEIMAEWLWRALAPNVSDLVAVLVRESPECACLFRGTEKK